MATQSFHTGDKEVAGHVMMLGVSGVGRSSHLEAEAKRRGISYEALRKELEPTPEQKETERMNTETDSARKSKRLEAVLDAYLLASEERDLYRVHDVLVDTVFVGLEDGPSTTHVEVFLKMLPASIIGKGISWGFCDTEVGDDMHVFATENKTLVIERLGISIAPIIDKP
jgi:hypothetical protein